MGGGLQRGSARVGEGGFKRGSVTCHLVSRSRENASYCIITIIVTGHLINTSQPTLYYCYYQCSPINTNTISYCPQVS